MKYDIIAFVISIVSLVVCVFCFGFSVGMNMVLKNFLP